jgi:2-oxoglutarate ferredoxin oxidoreductase subunit beta
MAEQGVVTRPGGGVEIVDVASVGEDALLRHDESAEDPSLAFALSRLSHTPVGPTPIGIFRGVQRPVYDTLMAEQIEVSKRELGEGDLAKLLHAGDTWDIN